MDGWLTQSELSPITAMIVPAYFSERPSDDTVRRLLSMTLDDCHHYLPLGQVYVVVDGDRRTSRIAREIRGRLKEERGCSFRLLSLPRNRGKLWAIKEGATSILRDLPQVQYLVVRDGDGDHVISDMPALLRAASHMSKRRGDTQVIAIGSRPSRHRPMGWMRGELESLLDQLTLDSLSYRLAREGRALDLSRCLGTDVPDLSSGYKAYGREAARMLFLEHTPTFASLDRDDYWRYGPETVTVVEALLGGTAIAETRRLTWDGQPTSSFGEFRHLSLYGELLTWVYTRLEIPLEVGARLFDNLVPSLYLRTTAEGRELLSSLRETVLAGVRDHFGWRDPLPSPRPPLPFI